MTYGRGQGQVTKDRDSGNGTVGRVHLAEDRGQKTQRTRDIEHSWSQAQGEKKKKVTHENGQGC